MNKFDFTPQTLKLIKKHINNGHLDFEKEPGRVLIDLSHNQIRRLLKPYYGRIKEEEFEEKLGEFLTSFVSYILPTLKEQHESKTKDQEAGE